MPKVILNRTREQLDEALRNADCPLFEAIVRWVVQDKGYVSMAALVQRIKELEDLELSRGILPIHDLKAYQRYNGL